MNDIIINIANDFTDTPGPRYIIDGEFSGELFRETILLSKYMEARENKVKLIIETDGTFGYPPSFLEESFGGLRRKTNDSYEKIMDIIVVKCDARPYLMEKIIKVVKEAFLWKK